MAGDFGQIANYAVKVGEDFVAEPKSNPALAFSTLRAALGTPLSLLLGQAVWSRV